MQNLYQISHAFESCFWLKNLRNIEVKYCKIYVLVSKPKKIVNIKYVKTPLTFLKDAKFVPNESVMLLNHAFGYRDRDTRFDLAKSDIIG